MEKVIKRINFTLNDKNKEDKIILDLLETRYNMTAYIKETLYQVARGQVITPPVSCSSNEEKDQGEEFEEINGEDIEIF